VSPPRVSKAPNAHSDTKSDWLVIGKARQDRTILARILQTFKVGSAATCRAV